MAHLMYEQQRHEARGERPAPQQAVGGDRYQGGASGTEQGQFRQQKKPGLQVGAELRRKCADARKRAADALAQGTPGSSEGSFTRQG